MTNSDAMTVGKRLVELCSRGQNMDAINELYSPDIVSIEACDSPDPKMPRTMKGIDAIRGKNQWWMENHEVHGGECRGPFPHQPDRFAVVLNYDVTFKPAKQRMKLQEIGLYTVAHGKIVKEEFFYQMPG